MTRFIQILGWVLSVFLMITLSGVLFSNLRFTKAELNFQCKNFNDALVNIDRKFELSNIRLSSLFEANKIIQLEFDRQGHGLIADVRKCDYQDIIDQEGEEDSTANYHTEYKIPEGIYSEDMMQMGLVQIEANDKINPEHKKLDRIETAEAAAELAKVQGIGKILDCEIQLIIAKGIENLRSAGEFIEYRSDEKYQTIHDVLTAAELFDGGVRMFYFYPEEYPSIYDRKIKKKQVAEEGLRKIITLLHRE